MFLKTNLAAAKMETNRGGLPKSHSWVYEIEINDVIFFGMMRVEIGNDIIHWKICENIFKRIAAWGNGQLLTLIYSFGHSSSRH